jgi:hypothetical protein
VLGLVTDREQPAGRVVRATGIAGWFESMQWSRVAAALLLLGAAACSEAGQPNAPAQPAAKPVPPAVAVSPVPPAPGRWTFDSDAVGSLPNGAQSFSGQWTIRVEPATPSQPNALCQTGTAEFPAISLDPKPFTDLTLTTRFKPISGRTDQAAGLIFRIQDKDNYYILRANALENNVNFYIYRGGTRRDLRGNNARVASGTWQELRVEVLGSQFRGFVNGQQVTDASDDSYKSGGIGLWTKADSVTCFDDVEATAP